MNEVLLKERVEHNAPLLSLQGQVSRLQQQLRELDGPVIGARRDRDVKTTSGRIEERPKRLRHSRSEGSLGNERRTPLPSNEEIASNVASAELESGAPEKKSLSCGVFTFKNNSVETAPVVKPIEEVVGPAVMAKLYEDAHSWAVASETNFQMKDYLAHPVLPSKQCLSTHQKTEYNALPSFLVFRLLDLYKYRELVRVEDTRRSIKF